MDIDNKFMSHMDTSVINADSKIRTIQQIHNEDVRKGRESVMNSLTAKILQKKLPEECVWKIMSFFATKHTLYMRLRYYCENGFYDGVCAATRRICVDNNMNMYCACIGGYVEIINLFITKPYDLGMAFTGAVENNRYQLVNILREKNTNQTPNTIIKSDKIQL